MRLAIRAKRPGEIEFGIIYGSLALLALAAVRLLPLAELLPSCVFRAFTGLPCPTCGITRSLVHFAHGDLHGAAAMNPGFTAIMASSLLFLLYNCLALFSSSRLTLSLGPRDERWLRGGAAALLLINWSYLVAVL